MGVELINPFNGQPLEQHGERLRDQGGNEFPVIGGIPRFCGASNYAESFGKQWHWFAGTQMDRPDEGLRLSEERLFGETGWDAEALGGLDILEVGSGAGRFSRVILEKTDATLWSVDYSAAVEANRANNQRIAPSRLHLFQASIYEMPFPDDSFDKVICLGVLQHTPDFEESVRALVRKAKRGGEIVVDFYPIRGFWTKIHAKYLLRPLIKRISHETLLKVIRGNAGWMISLSATLNRIGLSPLTRFVPICDVRRTMPEGLTPEQLREWVVLDTFDMFSPAYDNPQRLKDVAAMFRRNGASVQFAGLVQIGSGPATVVRATKD